MNVPQKDNSINQEVFTRNFNRYLARSKSKQIDIARAVGVSSGTISDWKIGRAYPRMDKVQALADYFGIQKSDLVEDAYVTKETVSGKEQKLLDLFHNVPEEYRDGVLELIEVYTRNLR